MYRNLQNKAKRKKQKQTKLNIENVRTTKLILKYL